MVDRAWIGRHLPDSELTLERGRLKAFAKAIGEIDVVYLDPDAAKSAGYNDLPAPPTFLFAAELDSGVMDVMLNDMSIPHAKLLHGEQQYRYHKTACAGDVITIKSFIEDVYDRKGGALQFVVKASKAYNQHDELVAELRTVLVCRS